jgi:predicted nucleic acid-binding protein
MKGILVDTSVWIDFFNDISTKEAELLNSYIETDFPVYICETILQEILQGFSRDRDYQIAKDLLLSYPFLQTDTVEFAMGAAEL